MRGRSKTFYKLLSFSLISSLLLAIVLTTTGYILQVKNYDRQFIDDAKDYATYSVKQLNKDIILSDEWDFDLNSEMQKEFTNAMDKIATSNKKIIGTALIEINSGTTLTILAQNSFYHELGIPLGVEVDTPLPTIPAVEKVNSSKTVEVTEVFSDDTGTYLTVIVPILNSSNEVVAIYANDYDAIDIINTKKAFLMNSIIAIIIVLALIILVQTIILLSIFKPLKILFEEVEVVGDGDLSVDVQYESKGEIGKLGNLFNTTVSNIREIIKSTKYVADDIKASSENLAVTTNEVIEKNNTIGELISEIGVSAKEQSKSAGESEETIMQLAEAVQHIAVNTQDVSEASNIMASEAESGHKQLSDVINQMEIITKNVEDSSVIITKLREKSKEIDQIINVISSIAEQTNLLALNASIEAARAGEHGKGFAVVAEEVRKLAEGSAESTNQISTLVNDIQIGVDDAVNSMERGNVESAKGKQLVESVSDRLNVILSSTVSIADQISDISSATEEISASSETIVTSSKLMTENAEKFLDDSEKINVISNEYIESFNYICSSIETVESKTDNLKGMIEKFKV